MVGGRQTYATIGYLRLNRDIDPTIEDLRDREEIRLGGRVRFAGYWSVFGSTVIDLTDRREDPLSRADGYEPVRHRIGISYDDDCLEIGVTWRRDYEAAGDFRRGNTFQFRVALKNLGAEGRIGTGNGRIARPLPVSNADPKDFPSGGVQQFSGIATGLH